MNEHQLTQPKTPAWTPWVILAVCAGLTLLVWRYADSVSLAREKSRLERSVDQTLGRIQRELRTSLTLLDGLKGLTKARVYMNREQFQAYVESLNLRANYPGIEGLGLVLRVKTGQTDMLPQFAENMGVEGFRLWPDRESEEYYPIIYLEPGGPRRDAAIGFDAASDPALRAAIEHAARTVQPTASSRVALAGVDADPMGFVVYSPVYQDRKPPETEEDRMRLLQFLVFCSFQSDLFFQQALNEGVDPLVRFRVFDDDPAGANKLLYDSSPELAAGFNGGMEMRRTVQAPERRWSVVFNPTPAFAASAPFNIAPWILAAGFIASLSLFGVARVQLQARESAEKYIKHLKASEREVSKLNAELERRVQERTSQLELANKELEAFSYSVSHDLRAPLRHISGFVNLLKETSIQAIPEASRRYLEIIVEAAENMNQLIDNLLNFSRTGREKLNWTSVDLKELSGQIKRELTADTSERNIQWRVGDLPTVRGDPVLLRQVLANLLENAVKYTEPRDPAEIEIDSVESEEFPDHAVIRVRDNGVGFDMKYADKLFGVFQRLHLQEEFEGTGIGLANVRRIVARHGGQTWAEGKVDGGAAFYFSLPIKEHHETTTPETNPVGRG